jgi:hypothetical protein
MVSSVKDSWWGNGASGEGSVAEQLNIPLRGSCSPVRAERPNTKAAAKQAVNFGGNMEQKIKHRHRLAFQENERLLWPQATGIRLKIE